MQILDFIVYTENGDQKQLLAISDCVKEWFEKPLNKSLQLSNWATDELSPEQMEYAALDAWVLIPLYEAIENDSRFSTNIHQAIRKAKLISPCVDYVGN